MPSQVGQVDRLAAERDVHTLTFGYAKNVTLEQRVRTPLVEANLTLFPSLLPKGSFHEESFSDGLTDGRDRFLLTRTVPWESVKKATALFP